MRKKCEYCGQFMPEKLHGACFSCLKSKRRLGPGLSMLYDMYYKGEFNGKVNKSVENILNCANTILFDGMWFAYKWNPLGNLKKVLSTLSDRPYLTQSMISELKLIVKGVEDEDIKAG